MISENRKHHFIGRVTWKENRGKEIKEIILANKELRQKVM